MSTYQFSVPCLFCLCRYGAAGELKRNYHRDKAILCIDICLLSAQGNDHVNGFLHLFFLLCCNKKGTGIHCM